MNDHGNAHDPPCILHQSIQMNDHGNAHEYEMSHCNLDRSKRSVPMYYHDCVLYRRNEGHDKSYLLSDCGRDYGCYQCNLFVYTLRRVPRVGGCGYAPYLPPSLFLTCQAVCQV
mmetsp:Transcript_4841/g.10707  ORF Transcript_4841/g.10707 Transcript_4841/m.10707 type:complete len:114 (-) Transcript_4841:1305-1646(-)